MLPTEPDAYDDVDTIIQLTDNPCDWLGLHPDVLRRGRGQIRKLTFSDYAVVMQAALAGQGIAFGWLSVVSAALRSGALLPASSSLTQGDRLCVLASPQDQKLSKSAMAIREWIIAEQRRDVTALDRKYPEMRFLQLAYQRDQAEPVH
jgi:DNA-binding transcriptional LysR family regulator